MAGFDAAGGGGGDDALGFGAALGSGGSSGHGSGSDAASQQKYVAWFLDDMKQYEAGKPSTISLGGKQATKVSGTAANGALIAFMLVVPEHHRRYLFMCSGDATVCESDVIANVTFR